MFTHIFFTNVFNVGNAWNFRVTEWAAFFYIYFQENWQLLFGINKNHTSIKKPYWNDYAFAISLALPPPSPPPSLSPSVSQFQWCKFNDVNLMHKFFDRFSFFIYIYVCVIISVWFIRNLLPNGRRKCNKPRRYKFSGFRSHFKRIKHAKWLTHAHTKCVNTIKMWATHF